MARHALPKSRRPAFGAIIALIASLIIPFGNPVVATASVAPTVLTISPDTGSSAGGTAVTITGTGFFNGGAASAVLSIDIGTDSVTDFEVVSDTTINATISARSGVARTIGRQQVVVETSHSSTSDQVFFSFAPVRDGDNDNATAANANGYVVLGDLASRTEGKPIFRSGSDPYFVDGTDGLTGLPYRYRTNAPYTHNPNNANEKPAYTREGTEAPQSSFTSSINDFSGTVSGRSQPTIKLVQDSNCTHSNDRGTDSNGDTIYSFCSIFGPEIYTDAFYGTSTQALSFDWYADGIDDDYEIYAYLVAVTDDVTIPTPSPVNHTLAVHALGYEGVSNFWQTSTANIPADGLYRFRFVNGSYDGTGGKALGSEFYVGSVFTAGEQNEIQFGPISDQKNTGTITVDATATSDAEVSVTSSTLDVCTVSTSFTAPTTSVTITTTASNAVCTLIATQGATGAYPAAQTQIVSFRILNGAAVSASAPVITSMIEDNGKLTFTFTQPAFDGSELITDYEYSVSKVVDGQNVVAFTSTSGTESRRVTVESLTNGTTYSVVVRAVTSFGAGQISSASAGTPRTLVAPAISYADPTQSASQGIYTNILKPNQDSGDPIAGYTISSGVLPAGMTLNTVTGFIIGTPTTVGTTTVNIEAYNSGGTSSPVALTIEIVAAPPTIAYSSATLTIQLQETMATFSPSFGGGALTTSGEAVTLSGTVPAGLSVDLATGEITGIPTTLDVTGSVIQVRAIGINNQLSGPFSLTIRVVVQVPNISYSQATYSIGVNVQQTIPAPTNTGGYVAGGWTISPELPVGLTLDTASGVISGIPTQVITMVTFVMSASNTAGTSVALISIEVLAETSEAPSFTYQGPIIESVDPNVVTVEGGETITVTGRRLGVAEELRIGSEPTVILSATATEITFTMPTMRTGVYDLTYIYSGGARLIYMKAITVVPKKVTTADAADSTNPTVRPNFGSTEAWLKPWSVTAVVSPFAPGRPDLAPHLKSQIRKHIRTYAQFASHVSCVGFTMGPNVLSVDQALSQARAKAVCDYIEELRPRLIVDFVGGRQDQVVADRIRRTEITFFRPAGA